MKYYQGIYKISLFNDLLDIYVMVSWLLSEKGICWPVPNDCIAGSSEQLIEVKHF